MAVDLDDMVEVVRREVSPPGTDLFPNATDDEFLGNLRDSFWEARLFGFFEGYSEAEGAVTPTSGSTDFSRDNQQLVVLFAGARILRNELRNINSLFSAKAGPVEFEQQKSAQVLKALLDDVRARIVFLVQEVAAAQVYYIDAVIGREMSIDYGETSYVVGSNQRSNRGYGGGWGW